MLAFRYLGNGIPGGDARVVEVPVPEPGPGEVLIRVGGAGLCASDLKVLRGEGSYGVTPPLTLGHENAGWVEALGAGVVGWEQGEPVVVSCLAGCGHCINCSTGDTNYCLAPAVPGITYDGGLAPFLLAWPAQLVRLGELPVAEAAPLADAGVTAFHAVGSCSGAFGGPGALVVLGVGGLGSLAIQIAVAQGWTTIIAVDAVDAKRDQALALGASDFLVAGPDTARQVADLMAGSAAGPADVAGVRAVIDLVGTDQTLAAALEVVRLGGRIVQVGTGHGTVPFGRDHVKPGVSLVQSRGGSMADLEAVVRLARTGALQVEIERFSLEETAAAYADLEAGRLRARAVVIFDQV
ncbi:alcohol dehydrogenase catalytic domain-containing protein [Citricoccus nitrophenolicus]